MSWHAAGDLLGRPTELNQMKSEMLVEQTAMPAVPYLLASGLHYNCDLLQHLTLVSDVWLGIW